MISDMIMDPENSKKNEWVPTPEERLDVPGSLPFLTMHAGVLLVFWAGLSWTAFWVAVAFYIVRMFGVTAGYHRYFSHLSFKTSRGFQFALGWLAASSGQMGPMWWSSHHRYHHLHSDTAEDIHSPIVRTIYWAHVGWILCKKYMATMSKLVRDHARYPELQWLDRWHFIPTLSGAFLMLGLGAALKTWAPGLETGPFQMLVWGFFISTVALYHGTFTINSFAHITGNRRFDTKDSSRNSWILAIITLGEGWHNNHHRYPASERQGFFWWEIDVTHYGLVLLSWLGLVWDLRGPAEEIYVEAELTRKLKASMKPGELGAMGLPE
jgi:stearoyl-CoA desaturase (delta-9 desaturase)